MIASRLTTDGDGRPVLTLTVSGPVDVFRAAELLASGRPEMHSHARRAFRFLARTLGRGRFAVLDQSLTGGQIVAAGLAEGRLR
jgi:ABC-type protease/lipase transport system fused ATPase/permease subunit